MLKKAIFVLSTFLLVLAIAGCSAVQSVFAGQSSTRNNSQNNQPTVNQETRYAIGIMKMEGSNLAVTADQAKTILPLYKAMLSLSTSSTAAPAELQGLDDQIKESLTADQVTEIEKLDLSGQNVRTIMQQVGIQFGGGFNGRGTQTPGQGSTSGQSNGSSRRSQGQFFQGGPGGGPGGPPPGGGGPGGFGGGNSTNGTQRTPRAFSTGTARNRANPMIINAVIAYLQKKAG